MSKIVITTKFLKLEAEVSDETAEAIAKALVDGLGEKDEKKPENPLCLAVYAAKFAQECGRTSPDAAHERAKHVARMAVELSVSDELSERRVEGLKPDNGADNREK